METPTLEERHRLPAFWACIPGDRVEYRSGAAWLHRIVLSVALQDAQRLIVRVENGGSIDSSFASNLRWPGETAQGQNWLESIRKALGAGDEDTLEAAQRVVRERDESRASHRFDAATLRETCDTLRNECETLRGLLKLATEARDAYQKDVQRFAAGCEAHDKTRRLYLKAENENQLSTLELLRALDLDMFFCHTSDARVGDSVGPAKARLDLAPPDALLALGRVLGAQLVEGKDPERWKNRTAREHIAAAMRHTLAHLGGETINTRDGGEPHLAHAFARLGYALAQHLRGE